MREITLTQGKVATIDEEDYERVVKLSWCALRIKRLWYARSAVKIEPNVWKYIYLHHFILGIIPNKVIVVDHQDRNGLNCCRSNLRVCTFAQNLVNSPGRLTRFSQYKGVYYFKRQKCWYAAIQVMGKLQYLGQFSTSLAAALAYDSAAKKVYGEFAYLNFISIT
jgi:hypothetical protein